VLAERVRKIHLHFSVVGGARSMRGENGRIAFVTDKRIDQGNSQ
jgi:hypothetical protein